MRVISKKRDYYDTAGYIDPSVVFVREEKEVFADFHYPHYSIGSHSGLLGFCGKFYPYIHRKVEAFTDERTKKFHPEEHYYYYSIESYLESDFWKERKRHYRYFSDDSIKTYTDFFNHWKDSDEVFVNVDAPYFRVIKFSSRYHNDDKAKLLLNPNLKDMQFGKVMDAHTAFQTIQFYLTNQLVKTKDPDEMDDKYKIAQHGFDKTSFRHPIKLKDLK